MNINTILGLGAIGGAIYLATNKTAQSKVKKTTGLSNRGKKRREKKDLSDEYAMTFKKTKDSDLKVGKEVLYPSVNGNIDLGYNTNFGRGKIKKISESFGIKEYHVGSAIYVAEELILIKNK